MGKVKTKKNPENVQKKEESLSFDELSRLEGSKKDLELFDGIDEEFDDLEVEANDFETEPINKIELKNFIDSLGIVKYRPTVESQDEDEAEEREKPEKKSKEPAKPEPKHSIESPKVEKKSKKKKNKFKVQDDEISSTTPGTPSKQRSAALTSEMTLDYMTRYQPRKYLLVKNDGQWFQPESSSDPKEFPAIPPEVEKKLKTFAEQLSQDESNLYKSQQESKKRSDLQWLKTVMTSGTLGDRVAALTVTIHNSPVHNLHALDTLVTMATKKGRREATQAVDTLKDLFINELLPEGKLKTFSEQPLSLLEELSSGNHDTRDRRLITWYYEEQLKQKYAGFVQALQSLAHDNITASKKKAICTICDLLVEKPECEKMLLTSLVNKLGDPESKIASLTAMLLGKLVSRHPNMKETVVQEVERLLYRSNVSEKAQYFGVCFLNQLMLSRRESALASRLVMLYFTFFKVFIKKNEVDSKMMAALLTGVNRAYPYAKVEAEVLEQQVNTLHKVLHVVQFNTAIHALMLLYQVMDSSESTSNRFYMALYRKMLDPALKSSSKQAMFLNLLFKSMKKDISDRRVQAFTKRLLQVCGDQNPTFICGALILLSEVIRAKPEALRLKQIAQSWEDDDEDEHFEDAEEEDENKDEDNEEIGDKEDRSEDYVENAESKETAQIERKVPTWMHRINVHKGKDDPGTYDPLHRNPVYCNAERSCVWELRKLQNHYHPSVMVFASHILQGENIQYDGDPLQDFTLIRFLDRFVFRNPKKKQAKNDDDDDEGGTSTTFRQKRSSVEPKGVRGLAVNSDEFLQGGEGSVPADEVFFFRYFQREAVKKKKVSRDDESDESVDDAEFDRYLDTHEKSLMAESKRDMDFASEMSKERSRKKDKKKKAKSESDDELSDEEMELSEDEDLKRAFLEEMGDGDSSDEDGLLDGEDDADWTDGDDVTSDDDIMSDGDAGFKEEDVEFSGDDDFAELSKPLKKGAKRGAPGALSGVGRNGKKVKFDTGSLFAAAEEFSHLMDEGGATGWDTTGSNAVHNKDNSDIKQLKWEQKREREMAGKTRRRPKGGRNKGREGRNKGKGRGRR